MDSIKKEPVIAGLITYPLKQISNDKGDVLHMVRSDAPHFRKFGEVYFSQIHAGKIKGWKKHKEMTQLFVVPVGQVQFMFYDDRTDSPSMGKVEEVVLGNPDDYKLLCVPPLIWYGFRGIAKATSLIANCSDIPHDPLETINRALDSNDIPYHW